MFVFSGTTNILNAHLLFTRIFNWENVFRLIGLFVFQLIKKVKFISILKIFNNNKIKQLEKKSYFYLMIIIVISAFKWTFDYNKKRHFWTNEKSHYTERGYKLLSEKYFRVKKYL